jgi:LmbE family N-acetylglucosaminyl deacetylase
MIASLLAGARALCLAPHPDDIEFGVGATLHKYREFLTAHVVVFTDRHKSRGEIHNETEQRKAAAILGIPSENVHFVDELGYGVDRLPIRFMATEESRDVIRQVLSKMIADFKPNVIFTPGIRETHQDHAAVTQEVVRVARGDFSIFGYEVPKHNRDFLPNAFVAVDEADIAAKVAAINAFTEFTTRYYFEPDAIRALARMRGLHAGTAGLVEAFEVYRLSIG